MGVRIREKVKGSGEWWIFVAHNGKRTSRKVGDRKAAEEVALKIQAKLTLGETLPEKKPPLPTLGEYYERFKSRYMKMAIKESSYIVYDSAFRVHTLPQLGKLRLDEIDREHIEEFISVLMRKDMAKDSIRVILGALRVLFNNAIEKKIIRENPVSSVGKFYRQAPVRHAKIEPLTEDESLLFLRTALEHEPEHYPLFLCSLHTGLRSGEVIALQWSDIDWNGKFIEIRRQLVRCRLTTLKTEHSQRRVDCSDDLLATLVALKKQRQEEVLKRGSNAISPWVFANEKGDRPDIGNIKVKNFKRVLRKAGLREIRYHDLRHTYASQLLAQGEPVTYVSQQLGHANPQITFKVYAHWIPNESQRQAVNRLPSLRRQTETVKSVAR
ncbi:MAG: tyrosine-type recombinase/integrase [Acidobacteria bacterium]|nr:tyrosine-type recombinase/integrase [Acidobacteriota bacterium]